VEGNPEAFEFSKTEVPDLNFSFSGIKTSFLYFLRDRIKADPNFIRDNIKDISASIQHTLVNMLLEKVEKASIQTGIKEIAIAGGVSANSALRIQLTTRAKDNGWNTFIPKFEYCTDNAAMIAIAGHFLYEKLSGKDERIDEQMLAVQMMPRMKF
jgi:N6-L-threonylcarbamoyladenine synthase